MLKKVLKYDLKFVFKLLIVFYILNIVFAVLTRLLSFGGSTIINILWHISSGTTISFIFLRILLMRI